MVSPEPSKNFEDHHDLYRGVKKNLWTQWEDLDRIRTNIFMTKQATDGLSVDWSKYTQPTSTLRFLNIQSNRDHNDLSLYGIIEINVRNLRQIIRDYNLPIEIQHDPNPVEQPNNDGHTLLILSGNIALIRSKLSEIADWTDGMRPIPD